MNRFLVTFALLSALAPAATSTAHKKQATANYSLAVVNDPSLRPELPPKSAGAAVLRAQILLDRANFSVGQIDGRIGSDTESALAGFRIQHHLPKASGIDQSVWEALTAGQAPALVSYSITSEDLKGPFVRIPADMMAKAALDFLGYASPLDELSEKFHIAPALLRQLNPGHDFSREGETIVVPNVLQDFIARAARVVVSKSANTVTALDQAGNILAQYPCTSGSEHDPLPIGEWKITGVAKNPSFHYNPELFWDAKPEHTKETIAPGPRSPVGVVWIDLSKEHYGIHGTPDPARVGHAQSHGCIRLTNWDALELARLVKPGTPASLVE